MTDAVRMALARKVFPWEVWARPEQKWPEGDWSVWLINAGRRFGKTRTGKEYTHRLGMEGGHRIALVARTHSDLRDIMIDGESGLLSRSQTIPAEMPRYNPSVRKLRWPRPPVRSVAPAGQVAVGNTSTTATTFSSEEPDDLRGPAFSFAWCDELAAWTHLEACWSNLDFALSMDRGDWKPRRIITTTPRPLKFLEELIESPRTVTTGGSLYDNADNLPEAVIEELRDKYEGTNLGEQEIWARILKEAEGALWRREWIERTRVDEAPELLRIVVAVDPPGSSGPKSAEAGIVVVGLAPHHVKKSGKRQDHYYVLDDRSMVGKPDEWAAEVVAAYEGWEADAVVAETNFGGEMVESTIEVEDDTIPVICVHAKSGKKVRAEWVASLHKKGRVHFVGGWRGLEDQMCTWEPLSEMPSPDRLDAFVYGVRELSGPGELELPDSLGGIGEPDHRSAWR